MSASAQYEFLVFLLLATLGLELLARRLRLPYIGGERLHVSGVLATVTTGLLLGWRQHADFTATTRIRAHAFWKVLVFLLQSILFILIGLSLRGVLSRLDGSNAAHDFVVPALGVIAAVIVSRFLWLFGSDLLRRLARSSGYARGAEPSYGAATAMSWAGMRGVVTLAAALSVPIGLPGRDLVLVSAFAVILVTVLLQGTTLGPLIRLMRLNGEDQEMARQKSEDFAWKRMTEAQFRAIAKLSRQPDGSERHPRLLEQYGHRARVAAEYTTNRDEHKPLKMEHFNVLLQAIDAARAEVLQLHGAGEIHDRILRDLESELDFQQMVAESHSS